MEGRAGGKGGVSGGGDGVIEFYPGLTGGGGREEGGGCFPRRGFVGPQWRRPPCMRSEEGLEAA